MSSRSDSLRSETSSTSSDIRAYFTKGPKRRRSANEEENQSESEPSQKKLNISREPLYELHPESSGILSSSYDADVSSQIDSSKFLKKSSNASSPSSSRITSRSASPAARSYVSETSSSGSQKLTLMSEKLPRQIIPESPLVSDNSVKVEASAKKRKKGSKWSKRKTKTTVAKKRVKEVSTTSADSEVTFNFSSGSTTTPNQSNPNSFSSEDESDSENSKDKTLKESEVSKSTSVSKRSTSESSSSGNAENGGEEFEVEDILDYQWCKATTQGLYFVKWQGWDESNNTWEPLHNLVGCLEKLKNFYLKRVADREAAPSAKKRFFEVPPDPRTNFERRSEFADQVCPPPCQSELEAYFERLRTHPVKEWKEEVLNKCFDQLAKSKKPHEEKRKQLREQIMLRHVREKRKEQLARLKEWEKEINQINGDAAKLLVENEIDLEGPPRQMTYINKYKPSPGIVIPDDPPMGCECEGGSCELRNEKTCCPSMNGQLFPYTKFGKLRICPGTPIYECNKRCKCGPGCSNRVVQNGRKIKLCIYRTENGCGWGVKTMENIKKGSFIVEYVGEVITNEEAEERGKKYDAEGRTYLFDLDFNKGNENPYTVDAALYGNVSHFINHSCDPNLAVFNVWIDCLDPDLPRLCLFAVRDIIKGEQLTFDYSQRTAGNEEDDVDTVMQENGDGGLECKCGSHRCRKIMFL